MATADRLAPFGVTIFSEMTALAVEHDAINLGQGFPDTDGPQEVLDAAIAAIRGGVNQYPPGPGFIELRQAIAAHQRRFYEMELDPAVEIVVTAGATEALAGAVPGPVPVTAMLSLGAKTALPHRFAAGNHTAGAMPARAPGMPDPR